MTVLCRTLSSFLFCAHPAPNFLWLWSLVMISSDGVEGHQHRVGMRESRVTRMSRCP